MSEVRQSSDALRFARGASVAEGADELRRGDAPAGPGRRRHRIALNAGAAALLTLVVIGVAVRVTSAGGAPMPAGATVPGSHLSASDSAPSTPPPTPAERATAAPAVTVRVGPTVTTTGNARVGQPRRVTESTAAARQRLTAALAKAVKAQLPGAAYKAVTIHFTTGDRLLQPFQVIDFTTRFLAFAEIRDNAGHGQVEFNLGPNEGYENPKRPLARFCDIVSKLTSYCETRLGPGGEHITVEVGRLSGQSQITEIRVDVFRPDGTDLVGVARNFADSSNQDPNTAAPQRPTPPMTIDQLIAVLLDPGLTLYP